MTKRLHMLLLLICCTLMASAQSFNQMLNEAKTWYEDSKSSIFPSWIGTATDNDLWWGVSRPTKDWYAARDMAIQNAVLYYLCANGGEKLVIAHANDEYTVTKNENGVYKEEMHNSTFQEKVVLSFTDFTVQVVHEYRNQRGECFVACKVNKCDGVKNSMEISRTWNENSKGGYMECLIQSIINHAEVRSYFDVRYGENTITYSCSSGEKSDTKSYGYPKCDFTAMQSTYGYKIDIAQSLGATQLMCLAMSPFVVDETKLTTTDIIQGNAEEMKINSTVRMHAVGKNQGWGLTLCKINKNVLSVAVNDQSSKMAEWDLNDDIRFTLSEGYSDTQYNRPLALAKIKAFYSALRNMALDKSMEGIANETYTESAKPTDVSMSSSMGNHTLSGLNVDWGYRGSATSPAVYVKVGKDSHEGWIKGLDKEQEESIEESIEKSINDFIRNFNP